MNGAGNMCYVFVCIQYTLYTTHCTQHINKWKSNELAISIASNEDGYMRNECNGCFEIHYYAMLLLQTIKINKIVRLNLLRKLLLDWNFRRIVYLPYIFFFFFFFYRQTNLINKWKNDGLTSASSLVETNESKSKHRSVILYRASFVFYMKAKS